MGINWYAYAAKAALLLVVVFGLLWIEADRRNAHEDLAVARAAQAQIIQAFTDSTRAKDEALRRLQQDTEISQAAVAAADQAARRAQQRAQRLQADLRQLARDDASVAAYLGTRIPPALLDRLRNGATAPGSDEDGNGNAPARSEPAEADSDASADR